MLLPMLGHIVEGSAFSKADRFIEAVVPFVRLPRKVLSELGMFEEPNGCISHRFSLMFKLKLEPIPALLSAND